MQVTTIGLDIAKNVFLVHGVDARGRVVLRKRLARAKVLGFFADLPGCLIGMEACGGAHYWARELSRLGHEARLMPPQYVKASVKTNEHDAADAEGCCEAVQRPSMRFVPIKSAGQQAACMLRAAPRRPPRSALGARRGVRDQLMGQRTATINALRAHLAEFGIVAPQRQAGVRQLLAARRGRGRPHPAAGSRGAGRGADMAEVAQHADPVHLGDHLAAEIGEARVLRLVAAGADEVLGAVGELDDADAELLEQPDRA
jgi:transposase